MKLAVVSYAKEISKIVVTATANSYVPTGELMQGETSSGKLYKGNITIEDIVTANSCVPT